MSDKTNERLEREAREALVAADLSAKMKQWRNPPPKERNGGSPRFRMLMLLLALGLAAWWVWPAAKTNTPSLPESPSENPAPIPPAPTTPLPQVKQEPIAQKSAATNKYLALAQSNYRNPDFGAEIRGNAATASDALHVARRAMAEKRPDDAIAALKDLPAEYQTDASYLKAHALFAKKKYVQSAALFAQLKGSVRYGEAAEWYGILARLPDFEHNKSLILNALNKIAADDGHTYQQEAKQLLEVLK